MRKLKMWPKPGETKKDDPGTDIFPSIFISITRCDACGSTFNDEANFSFCPHCGTALQKDQNTGIPSYPQYPFYPTTTTGDHYWITTTDNTSATNYITITAKDLQTNNIYMVDHAGTAIPVK